MWTVRTFDLYIISQFVMEVKSHLGHYSGLYTEQNF